MSDDAELHPDEVVTDGLSVRSYGPEKGRALLFSPGLGGNGDYWLPQVRAFARDFRVILYDHRGTGRSERAALRAAYDAADLASDIEKVLDGQGLQSAHLIGHAAGAIAALALADAAPDRLTSLTIVNGWERADRHFARCMAIRRAIFEAGGPEAYLRAQPLFLYPAEWISDHLDELDRETERAAATFQSKEALFSRMAALEGFVLSNRAAAFGGPVLVLAASDDMLVPPRCSDELAGRFADSRLLKMVRGGHAVNITDVEGFNAQLRAFITEIDPN